MIKNGSSIPLSQSTGTLPNVSEAMLDWFQPMVFTKITKEQVAFNTVERGVDIKFRGVWQPLSPQQLRIKPEGQRNWKWFMCHSDVDLELNTDEVIKYEGTQFRVMSKKDYVKYGYYEYHLVDDYTGSGPEVEE